MPEIEPRVAKLETSVASLHIELGAVRDEVRSGNVNLITALKEIRQEQNSIRSAQIDGRQVNWGWLLTAVAVTASISGAVLTAWLRPLEAASSFQASRLDTLQKTVDYTQDVTTRLDERMKVYKELSVIK